MIFFEQFVCSKPYDISNSSIKSLKFMILHAALRLETDWRTLLLLFVTTAKLVRLRQLMLLVLLVVVMLKQSSLSKVGCPQIQYFALNAEGQQPSAFTVNFLRLCETLLSCCFALLREVLDSEVSRQYCRNSNIEFIASPTAV